MTPGENSTAEELSGGVFVSHVHEDQAIADAFLTLIQDVTAGALPAYSSSSTASTSGIRCGDEWFQWIKGRVERADHVVALLTPRSVGKPWILFEAGLGKARAESSVFGLAIGMSVAEASVGPFGVFQNSSSEKRSLVKLCEQLTAPTTLNPRTAMIETVVDGFLSSVANIAPTDDATAEDPQAAALFQAIEDLKFLVKEQARHVTRETPRRSDSESWEAALTVLERERLAPQPRRRLLAAAASNLLNPAAGVLAEELLLHPARNPDVISAYFEALDRLIGLERPKHRNEWVRFMIEREARAVHEEAERRRERPMPLRLRAPGEYSSDAWGTRQDAENSNP